MSSRELRRGEDEYKDVAEIFCTERKILRVRILQPRGLDSSKLTSS